MDDVAILAWQAKDTFHMIETNGTGNGWAEDWKPVPNAKGRGWMARTSNSNRPHPVISIQLPVFWKGSAITGVYLGNYYLDGDCYGSSLGGDASPSTPDTWGLQKDSMFDLTFNTLSKGFQGLSEIGTIINTDWIATSAKTLEDEKSLMRSKRRIDRIPYSDKSMFA
jgi:hypothetical protein